MARNGRGWLGVGEFWPQGIRKLFRNVVLKFRQKKFAREISARQKQKKPKNFTSRAASPNLAGVPFSKLPEQISRGARPLHKKPLIFYYGQICSAIFGKIKIISLKKIAPGPATLGGKQKTIRRNFVPTQKMDCVHFIRTFAGFTFSFSERACEFCPEFVFKGLHFFPPAQLL